jgi:hypothetical protein
VILIKHAKQVNDRQSKSTVKFNLYQFWLIISCIHRNQSAQHQFNLYISYPLLYADEAFNFLGDCLGSCMNRSWMYLILGSS